MIMGYCCVKNWLNFGFDPTQSADLAQKQ